MKKHHIYIIIAFLLLFAIFFPFRWESYPDGTTVYSALCAKYISWHYSLVSGDSVENFSTTKIYFFPENQTDFEILRDEFFMSRKAS